jgi:glycosyltransferase involved in cell wall biosynthesis
MAQTSYRSSGGGQTVLASLGIDETALPSHVALRETRFHRDPLRILVCQNALNFVSIRDQWRLAGIQFALDPRQPVRSLNARTNAGRSETTVCLTSAMGDLVAARVPHSNIEVIPVTVPLDVIEHVTNLGWRTSELDGDFLHVGGILRYKRIEGVLSAIGQVRPKATLHLFGEGDPRYVDELIAFGKSRSVEVIRTKLRRGELIRAMGPGTTLVSNSAVESLGFPVAEAAALGCRVVASAIPAHREIASRLSFLDVELATATNLPEVLGSASKKSVSQTLNEKHLESWSKEWATLRSVVTSS